MNSGDALKIPENVIQIIETLENHGHEAYAVGGCVRDTLLGREPDDWDITTSAKPYQVKALFRRTIDTGIQHGTVTVMIGEDGYEVTTYRMDGEYEDHRHPKEVWFTPNLVEDLKRRDFTINAMAYNPKTGIVDKFDGEGDLERHQIRCVGDPLERFDEDALRMLRGIRFAGQLQFDLEEKTVSAIAFRASALAGVSAERIRTELTKLILAEGSDRLLLAAETGLSAYFFPEFDRMLATSQNNPHHRYDVGRHSLETVRQIHYLYNGSSLEKKEQTILAYAALLHDVSKPECKTTDEDGIDHFYRHPVLGAEKAREILRRLKFDNETVNVVTTLIRYHDIRYENIQIGEESQAKARHAMRRLMNRVGKDMVPLLFLLQRADLLAQSTYKQKEKLAKLDAAERCCREICQAGDAVQIKDLAVGGRELIQMGFRPGPGLGAMLKRLLEYVLENPEANEKEVLLSLAASWDLEKEG